MRLAFAVCAVTMSFVARGARACPPSKPDAFVVSKVLASDPRIDLKMDDTFSLSGAVIDVPTREKGKFAEKLSATLGGTALRRVDDGALDDPFRSGPSFEIPGNPERFDGAVLVLTSGGRIVARVKVDFEKGFVKPCVVHPPSPAGRPKTLTDDRDSPLPIAAPASPVPAPAASRGAAGRDAAQPKSSGCAFARGDREWNGAFVSALALATLLVRRRRYWSVTD
jgi:MYXO-CTERM domain-containing protein